MSDHDERHVCCNGRLEGLELPCAQFVERLVRYDGPLVTVSHDSADAGEVLGATKDPCASEAFDLRLHHAGYEVGIGAERTLRHDIGLRIPAYIGIGCEIEVEAKLA